MKINKNMIIAITITFCFIAAMFMAIPIKSQSSGQYDPWLDINDDGRINMDEIVASTTAFGTTGDPTKNVNVTNPKAMTVQEDLNLSVTWWGGWTSSIDLFATEGYDRMFVSAGIIDISNYNSSASVHLVGVNWYWGLVNGKNLTTTTYTNDYGAQAFIYVGNATTDIPQSCYNSAEFPVEAGQCSLSFYANSSLLYAWIKIRVSIYLAVGTTSPPAVQNTYVTNMPKATSQDYSLQTGTINITNNGWTNPTIVCEGYSRLSILLYPRNTNLGAGNNITVYLWNIAWLAFDWTNPYSSDFVGINGFNTTIYNGGGWNPPRSYVTETKAPNCFLDFNYIAGGNFPANWWVTVDYVVYLRNE